MMSTREQVISARRIVFRRSVKNSHDKSIEQPHYAIQQVQVRGSVNNYKHFEVKTAEKSEKQQQLHWSRSKQKETNKIEDFRAYQNGDLNEFFVGNEDRRISDVCLMNDHFILVKLPHEAGNQPTSEIQCIVNHVEQRPSVQNSRRVQPIESAIVGIQTVKEFQPVSKAPAALRHIQWKETLEEQGEMKNIVSIKDSPKPKSILNKNIKDGGGIIQRSPFQVVEVKNQAALVCLENNQPADPALLKPCESPPNPKRPAIRAFQWLINPFCLRFRRRKRPKTKPKIQAVIYKTYFMSWTKPSDVEYSKSFDSQTLRRIRSAIF